MKAYLVVYMFAKSFYVNILATFSRENINNAPTTTPATNLGYYRFLILKQVSKTV